MNKNKPLCVPKLGKKSYQIETQYFRSESLKHWPVLLYIPNLIGYARILSLIISFFYIDCCFWKFTFLYSFSIFLDCIDGMAARYFNQISKFGGFLDVFTDRATDFYMYFLIYEALSLSLKINENNTNPSKYEYSYSLC